MTPHIRENIFTWLVDWSLVTIMGNTPPPRDPNDDDDEDDGEEDEEDKGQDEELPVVREPTDSAAHSRLRQVEFAYIFPRGWAGLGRCDDFVKFQSRDQTAVVR
jgi:hypothetical protein